MQTVNYVGKKLSFENETLELMLMGLTGCSIEVLNQFYRANSNGFNLLNNIQKNLALYQNLSICLISCNRDHIANYKIAEQINALLPKTSAAIILNSKHMTSKWQDKIVFEQICLGLMSEGHIPEPVLEQSLIARHTISSDYQKQLRHYGFRVIRFTINHDCPLIKWL